MKAIKILSIAAIMAAALAPGALANLTIGTVQTVGGYGPYQTGLGGEFTLRAVSPALAANVALYGGAAFNQLTGPGNTPNFQTFCVEGAENIYPNTLADVTISQATMMSGTTLKMGAAWLYSKFATGTWAVYDYTNPGRSDGTSSSASQLQRAIWMYMGQEGLTTANIGANVFVNAVNAAIGAANAMQASNGAYNVAVLNLWGIQGNLHYGDAGYNVAAGKMQDQLILIPPTGNNPVPDGGLTIALLGMSLAGIAALRRKFQPAS